LAFALLSANAKGLEAQTSRQTSQSGFVKTNGVSLYYEIYGHGTPLIVLHGGPGLDHTYLLPQLLKLADHYKLIFYDQRATGQSSGTVDSSSMTIDNFVEDLEGLRQALHLEKINILGHSWGTLLSMEYAIKYPQHVGKMILANTLGPTPEWIPPFVANRESQRTPQDSIALIKIRHSEAFAKRDLIIMRQFAKIFFKSYFYDQSLDDSLSVDFNQETANNILPIFSLMGKQLSTYNITSELEKLNCPVLILHGDHDPIPLKFAEETQATFKGSNLVVLKNCGHFSYIEAPDQFFEECEKFLTTGQ